MNLQVAFLSCVVWAPGPAVEMEIWLKKTSKGRLVATRNLPYLAVWASCLAHNQLAWHSYHCSFIITFVLYCILPIHRYSFLKIICQAMQSNMLQLTVRIELFITDDTYSKCKVKQKLYTIWPQVPINCFCWQIQKCYLWWMID